MGIVICFRARRATAGAAGTADDPLAEAVSAVRAAAGHGDRYAVLDAAGELLAICRDRYGFTVMQDGLPREPQVLAEALVALLRGLSQAGLGGRRPFPGFGVYFGRARLGWFEDGTGGSTALAVPDRLDAGELARFVEARLRRARG